MIEVFSDVAATDVDPPRIEYEVVTILSLLLGYWNTCKCLRVLAVEVVVLKVRVASR